MVGSLPNNSALNIGKAISIPRRGEEVFYFTTRKDKNRLAEGGTQVIDVSSRAPKPYCHLSPFCPHGGIPVPGMEDTTADSVEGVWQGLKIIDGGIDESRFRGRGRKRRGKPVQGHLYGDKALDYIEARKLIHVPLYKWMVYNAPLARDTALDLLKRGQNEDIYLHDFEVNPDVEDRSKPLAHAALLVNILNENLEILNRYRNDEKFRKAYDAGKRGQAHYILADLVIRNSE